MATVFFSCCCEENFNWLVIVVVIIEFDGSMLLEMYIDIANGCVTE